MLPNTKTLSELQDQIIPTKRDALIALNNDSNVIADAPIRTYRKDGQIESQADVDRDVETDAQIGARLVTYTYYPTGEVNVITISTRDANNKQVATKTIKHFTDSRQPQVAP